MQYWIAVAWIDLRTPSTSRDLGELPTDGGGRIQPRRLLRADNLQDLSPADISLLVDELGMTTVIDLRSTTEVKQEGPGPADGRRRGAASALIGACRRASAMTDAAAEALAMNRQRAAERDGVADLMQSFYLGYLEDRPENIVAALRAVAAAPGAALVHCAAGKDRTGTVVAMALTVGRRAARRGRRRLRGDRRADRR